MASDSDLLQMEVDGVMALVRQYADLLRAGEPAIVDEADIASCVYAEEREGGVVSLMLCGGGPSVYLDYTPAVGSAQLRGVGCSESYVLADDPQGSLEMFAKAYLRR